MALCDSVLGNIYTIKYGALSVVRKTISDYIPSFEFCVMNNISLYKTFC